MIPNVATSATVPVDRRRIPALPRSSRGGRQAPWRAAARGAVQTRSVLRVAVCVALAQWPLDAAGVLPLDSGRLLGITAVATLAALTLIAVGTGLRLRAERHGEPWQTVLLGSPEQVAAAWDSLRDLTHGRLTPVAGCLPEELPRLLVGIRPELVLALPGAADDHGLRRVGWHLERAGIPLLVGAGLADVHPRRVAPTRLGRLGVVALRPAARQGAAAVVKSLWERIAAVVGLTLLAPVLLALTVLVKLDSAGPALFRQTRVGRDGRTFTMLKFRTMYVDAEQRRAELTSECDGPLFKVRADPRVTRVGRVLRKFSLDELPQLVNVVAGSMALVGPRPALPAEVSSYDVDPRRRLAVRPGLTGLWQVSGRSDLSWEESVRLDLDYVDNWTLQRDLVIVARTLRAVLSHRGAY
ncbi:sugar transferase [Nocardioides sp.]|uniref:sugar transferase n=1 Tax=Nocardioides sp. TaxID=35761 RepID=UPI0039E663DE